MLLKKTKKIKFWILPLFLILFAFYYALISNINVKNSDNFVSIIVRAKIEKDDTLQFFFSTADFTFSERNSKKIYIKGSPNFQDIVCTLPDFIKVQNIKIVIGTLAKTIKIKRISIQKNGFHYLFGKNDLAKLFKTIKGCTFDPEKGEFITNEESGILKPYIQSRNISALYESVILSNSRNQKTLILSAFFITVLTSLIIFFYKNLVKNKLFKYSLKLKIKIFKNKIKITRLNILLLLLLLFISYVFIFGNIKNDSFSIIKNDITSNAILKPLDSKIYDSIPLKPSNNLIYNGNLENGFKFWTSDVDTSNFSIINTPFGKGLRISVEDAFGQNWFLKYKGRPIVYYPGHKYQLKFKYKIIKGDKNSFKYGWSIKEKKKLSKFIKASDLEFRNKQLNDGWNEMVGEYLFNSGHTNLNLFLNSVKDLSIIDIADIQLIDLYKSKNYPAFYDQVIRSGKIPEDLFKEMQDDSEEEKNLLHNGNFNYALLNWWAYADSTTLDWIDTPYGKGVRITRTNGSGKRWFSLFYMGPPINYKANHKYNIEFKFRVVKGKKIPFDIGWLVKDNSKHYLTDLPLKLTKLSKDWFKATTSYTFMNSHSNPYILINNLKDHSTVEITDIKISNDEINKIK